ncbi:hypothetical protein N0V88_002452 [Collariella sp. IMI 366227]|nr:hypothetical protein N0V88_002452 [Collariella sp. IMI 366227]
MADTPAQHVALHLSVHQSSGPEMLCPERRIILSPENKDITIGRSSKVSTKGYLASPDNAWFDSPLMSRLHARIVANKVEIKDLGSLHGTYLNGGDRIPTRKYQQLKDGDTLRFGVPIWRGTEQFIPATIKVGIRFPQADPTPETNVFRVPDCSEDEVSDSSESEIPRSTTKLDSNLSASIPGRNVIDLTTTAPGHSQAHEVIDLSSPCLSPVVRPARMGDDGDGMLRAAAMEFNHGTQNHPHAQPVTPGPCKSAAQYNTDRSVSTLRLDALVDEAGLSYSPDTDEDERYSVHDDADMDDPETDSEAEVDYADEESDGHLDEHDGVSDSYDEELDDYDSEDGYSTDYDAWSGTITPSDEDILDLNASVPWRKPSALAPNNLLGDSGENSLRSQHSPARSLQRDGFPELSALVESLSRQPEPVPASEPEETKPKPKGTISIERLLNSEPSSEAAHATPSGYQKTLGDVHGLPLSAAAEILGAKTGKSDFFSAREANKMTLAAQKAQEAAGTAYATPFMTGYCGLTDPWSAPVEQSSFLQNDASHIPSAPINDQFLGHHLASPSPINFADVEFPKIRKTQAGHSSRRTHMGISDILDTTQLHGEPKPKRKAEDISVTTQEQESWATGSKMPDTPSQAPATIFSNTAVDVKKVELNSSENQEQAQKQVKEQVKEQSTELDARALSEAPAETLIEAALQALSPPLSVPEASITIPVLETTERPAKRARIMRVAERLGYAALGGVTTGAVVLGTLIYTAPTFS